MRASSVCVQGRSSHSCSASSRPVPAPPPPLVWLRRCKSAASTPSASLDAEHQDVATAATMFLLSDKLEGDALVTWRALSQKAPAASKERLLKVLNRIREAGFVRLVERMQVPAARQEPLDPPNARAMLPKRRRMAPAVPNAVDPAPPQPKPVATVVEDTTAEIELVLRSGQTAFPQFRLWPGASMPAGGFLGQVATECQKRVAHIARSTAGSG